MLHLFVLVCVLGKYGEFEVGFAVSLECGMPGHESKARRRRLRAGQDEGRSDLTCGRWNCGWRLSPLGWEAMTSSHSHKVTVSQLVGKA